MVNTSKGIDELTNLDIDCSKAAALKLRAGLVSNG